MFFDSWSDLLRVLVLGLCTYVAVIVLVRAAGNRTLSKMTAFDLVVTVALGSILAMVPLNAAVSLSEGVLALALLIGLQLLIALLTSRVPRIHRWVAGEPVLLLHDGAFLRKAMRHQRINEDEVRQALRQSGIEDPLAARFVVLETDGSFSVVRQ